MNDDASHPSPAANRLAGQTSPYLLQHAHNPVDWYPWGPEAFEKARRENKPIFLSVGYSTCYWCHVMERQSFENPDIAALMNQGFVNIKVDREERPDVDQLYMTAVQVLTRQGGWPMSVWLTPELKPFYAGTYFPPDNAYGRPGFPTVLRGIEDAFRNRAGDVDQATMQLVDVLGKLAQPPAPSESIDIDAKWIDELIDRSTDDYDPVHGGFGGAPKFPRQTVLELLLVQNRHQPVERRMAMLRHTLDALAAGGIRDHLGGAFHRYSTDARWLVPHFEIMLYDNAMLAWIYAEAFRQTGYEPYAAITRGILDFVLREMTSPQGGFYTAFDAEVDALEGASYLWTAGQIAESLSPPDAQLFNRVYGIERGPNFADPHHGAGVPDQNILYLPKPLSDVAQQMDISADDLEQRLLPLRQTLYAVRRKRKQPLLDTKIITSWNALMIRAFAHAGDVLQEERFVAAAARGAEFLLAEHRTHAGALFRTSRDGRAQHDGFLDDYAHFSQALLALAVAQPTAADRWRQHAIDLTAHMSSRFGDGSRGGFFFSSADADDLIIRQKVGTDSPLPSGNAVAAMVLLELGEAGKAAYIVRAFAQSLASHGESASALVQAASLYVRQAGPLRAGSVAADIHPPASVHETARRVVQVETEWYTPTDARVRLHIAPGYHLTANSPSDDQSVVRTELSGIGAEVEYPPGTLEQFEFNEMPIRVYAGTVELRVRFDAPSTSQRSLRLTYQACSTLACLPPVTVTISV